MVVPPNSVRGLVRVSRVWRPLAALVSFVPVHVTMICVAVGAESRVVAQEPTVDARETALAEVGAEVVPELLALAEWCESQKLLASRLAAYEAVLVWQPDHADARRILGWRRAGGGSWERSRPEQARKDKVGLEAALAERHAALVQSVLAASEQRADALGRVGLAAARRRLLTLVPDDEALRAALDEVRLPSGAWGRADAARALARAETRKAEVASAKAAVAAPERLDATALGPLQSKVKWLSVARSPRAFVAGTIGFAESAAIAVAVDVTPGITAAALPGVSLAGLFAEGSEPPGENAADKPEWWHQPRFYVLQTSLEREALLGAFAAGLDQRMQDHLRRVATGFLDLECSIGIWSTRPVDRIEAAVRQRVGLYLQRTFGISSDKGWVWEGIGLLLSGSVTGTKNLVYIQLNTPTGTVAADGRKPRHWELFGVGADWLVMARDLLSSTPRPNLAPLLGKNVNAMDKEDLLLAHALGTWLVDGHPDKASRVLARIGANQPSVVVLEEELGLPLPELVDQLAAWLGDMRPGP
jgi:hypothetical protein